MLLNPNPRPHQNIESSGGRRCLGALVGMKPGQEHLNHPLKYPKKMTADGLLICRYHNYDVCKKEERCPFDHNTCHCCGVTGHVAKTCDAFGHLS